MKSLSFVWESLLAILLIAVSLTAYAQADVKPALAINPGPYDTICAGTRVIFTAVSVGAGNHPVFNWSKNGRHIKGTIGDTYATSDLQDGDIISCTLVKSVSNANSISITAATRLTVHNIPAVAIVNSNSPLCEGDTMRLYAYSVNEGTTYHWTGPGDLEATCKGILAIEANADGYYKVTALLNGCSSAPDSTYVIVNKKVTPQITLIPAPDNTVCVGTPVTLTASIEHGGNNPAYQWLKNGTPIPGATNNSYLEMDPVNGDSITLLLTSNAICPTSKTVSSSMPLIVTPYFTPSVTISSNMGNTITQGAEVILIASPAGSKYVSYQWKRNGISIPGANGKTFTTNDISNNEVYSVSVSTTAQCVLSTTANSNKLTMHVLPPLSETQEQSSATAIDAGNGNYIIKGAFPNSSEANIEVLSVIGQCVYKETVLLQNGILNVRLHLDIPNGIYIVRSRAGSQSFTQRIVVRQ
ncbi:MAG: T9SS type A sorting domain-containing protein [Flavipsychrobacter sp.]